MLPEAVAVPMLLVPTMSALDYIHQLVRGAARHHQWGRLLAHSGLMIVSSFIASSWRNLVHSGQFSPPPLPLGGPAALPCPALPSYACSSPAPGMGAPVPVSSVRLPAPGSQINLSSCTCASPFVCPCRLPSSLLNPFPRVPPSGHDPPRREAGEHPADHQLPDQAGRFWTEHPLQLRGGQYAVRARGSGNSLCLYGPPTHCKVQGALCT